MTDKKDFTPQEYESIIEELIKENEALKKRIAELENRDTTFRVEQEPVKKAPTPVAVAETSEPVILVEEPMKKEEIIPIKRQKEIVVSESIFSQETTHLKMGKGQIMQGISRRECPKCGNTSKALIREIIDKTHMISDYPRIFGKKYRCGECSSEWRITTSLE